MSLKQTVSVLLLALLATFITHTAASTLQDEGFIFTLPGFGSAPMWVWEVDSAHPDAPHFGLGVSAHNNAYCGNGNPVKDVVYQMGMNADAGGNRVLDPRWAAVTLNWESHWCNTAGQPMSEWQVRYILPNGTRGRFIHTELNHVTNKVTMQLAADSVSVMSPTGVQIIKIVPGRIELRAPTVASGGVGMYGVTPPANRAVIDLSTVDACELALVLASYGMVSVTGTC